MGFVAFFLWFAGLLGWRYLINHKRMRAILLKLSSYSSNMAAILQLKSSKINYYFISITIQLESPNICLFPPVEGACSSMVKYSLGVPCSFMYICACFAHVKNP